MNYPLTISLPFTHEYTPDGQDNADQYPASLVRYFLKNYTKKKDRVFDPFMGFGTTAFVAEDMGRIPYGIEADGERYEWSAGQLKHWNHIIHGDSNDMLKCDFPKMDFCITSPPFMPYHQKWNPLFGGDPKHQGYDKYLKRMELIFKKLSTVMKKNALVIVQVDNIPGKRYTPLVRDFSNIISKNFRLEGEIIVNWENAPNHYPHTHCLVFKNVL